MSTLVVRSASAWLTVASLGLLAQPALAIPFFTQADSMGPLSGFVCITPAQGGLCDSTGEQAALLATAESSFISGTGSTLGGAATANLDGLSLHSRSIGGGDGGYVLPAPVGGVTHYTSTAGATARLGETFFIGASPGSTIFDWSLSVDGFSTTDVAVGATLQLLISPSAVGAIGIAELIDLSSVLSTGSGVFSGSVDMRTLSTSVTVEMILRTLVTSSAPTNSIVDFSHTAALSLTFDPTLEVTRASGLAVAPPPAQVPEPPVLWLTIAGVLIAVFSKPRSARPKRRC